MNVNMNRGAGPSPAKLYAQVAGVILVLLGIVGLIMGDPADGLFGLLNIDIVEDIVHLAIGAVLLYLGFAPVEGSMVRTVVGVIGATLLLVGVLGFISPKLFGLLQHDYRVSGNLVDLLLGAAAVAVGFMMPGDTTTTTTTRT